MSNNINASVLKQFIVKTIGADKLTEKAAQKYDINNNKFDEANIDENNYLDLDEIVSDSDLYEQFATLFVTEQEQKAELKDEEEEKEEQTKVQDKDEAGV